MTINLNYIYIFFFISISCRIRILDIFLADPDPDSWKKYRIFFPLFFNHKSIGVNYSLEGGGGVKLNLFSETNAKINLLLHSYL